MKTRSNEAVRRPALRDKIRTVYAFGTLGTVLFLYVALLGLPLLIAAYTVDKRRRMARRIARALFPRMIRHYCRLGNIPLVLQENGLAWREIGPCIVVANHASAMDVILLMELPAGVGDGRVWAKGWPFKTLLLGWLMNLSGHLHVADFNILPDAQECLTRGESMLVFPESSRSRTGKVGRFRDGAFLLSIRTGMPIVPVAIHGSRESFPPGQPWVFRLNVRIEVLGVLWPGAGPRAHVELKRQAHEMICQALEGSPAQAVAA